MLMLLSKSSSRDTCLFLIFYLIEILNAQLLILSMGNNIKIGKGHTNIELGPDWPTVFASRN